MTEANDKERESRKRLKTTRARRTILLLSTAAPGRVLLLAGPGGYEPLSLPALHSSARAADSTSERPASFADLVAKVKPAGISVRVKVDESQNMSSMDQNGGNSVVSFAPVAIPLGQNAG
ncbi:MAG TPA: hypothetical protein VGJ20_23610 [Xanthobacteraceae bacterium]